MNISNYPVRPQAKPLPRSSVYSSLSGKLFRYSIDEDVLKRCRMHEILAQLVNMLSLKPADLPVPPESVTTVSTKILQRHVSQTPTETTDIQH